MQPVIYKQHSPLVFLCDPNRAMKEELRWAIVHEYKTCGSVSETARRLKTARKNVYRWVQRYITTGGVTPLQKPGRRHAISAAAAEHAVQLLTNGSQNTARQVANLLHAEGLTASTHHRTTITRAAKKAANLDGTPIRSVRALPEKRLSVATKAKRLRFAQANAKRRWDTTMFTDRKKFMFSFPGSSVKASEWKFEGQKRQAFRVNHASTLNIYVGITKWSATACHVVAGTSKFKSKYLNKRGHASKNITASQYKDVLEGTLLPEGKRIFATHGIGTWVLQQDNDPSHNGAANVISKWNDQHNSSVSLMRDWPPSSPDLSPIENFWSWVQARVLEKGCKTFEDFSAAVVAQVKNAPKSIFKAYYSSMHTRMLKTIELGGGKTKY